MTDLRFYDVVIESHSMIGPSGTYHTAVCKTCSKKHKVETDDFLLSNLYTHIPTDDGYETKPANALDMRDDGYKAVLKYVAEMRAWNCCHEREGLIDGFPNEPEVSRIDFEDV